MSNSKQSTVAQWRKTKRGLVTNLYNKMKSRHPIDFDLLFLHEFAQHKKFNRLFDEWVRSGYQKNFKPSIDRINHHLPYLKTNIQWLSWGDNRHKQTMERRCRKGSVLQLLDGVVIAVHKSQREAVAKTGFSQGNISSVLNGHRPVVGGYTFKYQNPELLKP